MSLDINWEKKTCRFKWMSNNTGSGPTFQGETGDVMTGKDATMTKIIIHGSKEPIADVLESINKQQQASNSNDLGNAEPRYYGQWIDNTGSVQLVVDESGVKHGRKYLSAENNEINERMNMCKYSMQDPNNILKLFVLHVHRINTQQPHTTSYFCIFEGPTLNAFHKRTT